MNSKNRLLALDSLRGLAAVFVLFHHACLTCWEFPEVRIPAELSRWMGWLKYGHLSVTFFIVLSGFVITLPLARDASASAPPTAFPWAKFFRRRAKRILPPYYAALVCSLALAVHLHGWKGLKTLDVLGHLSLLHDWGVGNNFAFNGPMWSVPVEWHIYFTVPILYLCGRKYGAKWVAAGWVVIAYIVFWSIPVTAIRNAIAPHYYGIFVLGGAAAFALQAERESPARRETSWGLLTLGAGFTAIALLFFLPWESYVAHYEWCDLMFGIFAALLFMWLATCESIFRRVLETTVLVGIGEMSYSLYLVHGPLLAYANDKLTDLLHPEPSTRFLLLCAAASPVVFGMAYIFHRIFERPFMTKAKRPLPASGCS